MCACWTLYEWMADLKSKAQLLRKPFNRQIRFISLSYTFTNRNDLLCCMRIMMIHSFECYIENKSINSINSMWRLNISLKRMGPLLVIRNFYNLAKNFDLWNPVSLSIRIMQSLFKNGKELSEYDAPIFGVLNRKE